MEHTAYTCDGNGNQTVRQWQRLRAAADADENGALRHYYQFNAHGDVVQQVWTENGESHASPLYVYDAFGNQYRPGATGDPHQPEADPNPFRYCGEYWDRETGEVYLRARYYSPATGRFGAEDSIRSQTIKMPNGQEIVDPLSLNLYTYCHSNPIMYIDPSGNSGKWVNLGKGWRYRIEPAHVDNGKGDHIHIEYKDGKKVFSQNDDGSPHDDNNNSPGSPPKKVLERLKEDAGWDWNAKMDAYAETVDISFHSSMAGTWYDDYLLIYPDGKRTIVSVVTGYNLTAKDIWEAYHDAITPDAIQEVQPQPETQGPYITPILPPAPVPVPVPFSFGFPAFAF